MNKILIVEDEQSIAEMVKLCLCKNGYMCEIVNDGMAATQKIEEKRYDLILLEDDVKPLSGLIIMKKLLMIKSFNTKVILLTGNNEYKDSYKEYGFSDVILKPIDEEIFNNIIDKYLK